MNWYFTIALLVIMLVLSNLVNKIGKKPKSSKNENVEDYKDKYCKRRLLSKNEENAFYKIKDALRLLNLQLFTKVRLADIVEPISGKGWQTLFFKIKAKHVDFLVVDNNFNIVCVIEIDDNSHDKDERKTRDKFVDYILQDVGIKTIRKRGAFTSTELQQEIRILMIK